MRKSMVDCEPDIDFKGFFFSFYFSIKTLHNARLSVDDVKERESIFNHWAKPKQCHRLDY